MSDTPTPFPPALQPESWDAVRDLDLASAGPDMLALRFGATRREGNPRHALAALCLYQQPFGFTHDDVTLIERFMPDGPSDPDRIELRERLRSLASRISALLPPQP